ncbi:MAG: putative nucleic acid-binding Zn-ribbon protein [Oleiphilaceae bacterium]|jgi:predicted  nucleic acid-binding Zn-ribbon protein
MINHKKFILRSAIAIALVSTTINVMAQNSNFLNGKPFKALNESIQANTDAIVDNAAAIDAMALEVDTLFTQVAAIDVRVTANETSISAALTAIDDANGAIDALATTLFNLQASVSLDIAEIRAELLTIQSDITTLTGNLAALSAAVSTQVDLLMTAITDNTADIAIHTANLTILNSNMATVQTAITLLQGQASQTEIDLVNQQSSIDNLSAVLNTVDVRVTALELLPPDSDAREFTIIDTGYFNDLTNAGFREHLTTLSLQANDYLYVYGIGVNGVVEICTNDLGAKQAIDGFIGGYIAVAAGHYNNDTWMRRNVGWVFVGSQYVQWRAYNSGSYQTLGFYVSLSGNSGQNGQVVVTPNNSYGHEIFVSGYGWGQQQSVTYRASSTRLDACGF